MNELERGGPVACDRVAANAFDTCSAPHAGNRAVAGGKCYSGNRRSGMASRSETAQPSCGRHSPGVSRGSSKETTECFKS